MIDESSQHGFRQELEDRAREGDRSAAEAMLGQHREDLIRFCYRYLGEIHGSEDAAQDVLTKLSEPGTWPKGSFRAYLFRVARNHCLNLVKRRHDGRQGVGSFIGDSRLPSPRTGPRTAAARQEEQEVLRQHLSSLPRNHAEVLMMRYFEELSRKEIAEVLELEESVVKSRLHEGLQALHQRVAKDRTKDTR